MIDIFVFAFVLMSGINTMTYSNDVILVLEYLAI